MKIRVFILRMFLLVMAMGAGTLTYGAAPTYAQDTNCNKTIRSLQAAISECSDINNNWACYGYPAALASPPDLRFQRPRDRLPISELETVNTDAQGAVFMYLFVEGQAAPMAVIAFGGVNLVPVGDSNYTLDIADPSFLCQNSPPGIAVRTETGESGSITINGVTIDLKSTAFITMQADGSMVVVNMEGSVNVSIPELGVSLELPVGYQVAIVMENGAPVAVGEPVPSPIYASAVLKWLTFDGLPNVHNSDLTDLACVGTIAFGETVVTQNSNAGQECLYRFCAKAGDVASIQMNGVDASLDPWLDLRLPSGELWSTNNDLDETDSDSIVCNRGLPVTSCDYTIVARPYRNASYGQFALNLAQYTACEPPKPRCEVVARGLNLRSGPGIGYPRIDVLVQDTQLQPLESPQDKAWVQVRVLHSGAEGWVSTDGRFLACEPPAVVAASPPLPISPTPKPVEDEDDNGDDKVEKKTSPFGNP